MTRHPHAVARWTGMLALFLAGNSPAAPVKFLVTDASSGEQVPCRIHLMDDAGKPVEPPGFPFWKNHFVCNGRADLKLEPGTYRYEIDRGPEYHLIGDQLVVAGAESKTVGHSLRRIAHLAREGWWSGEMHIHRPARDVPLLMQAEDLHVGQVITWWNKRNPWGKSVPANPLVQLDGQRFYHLMAGEDERAGGALLYFNLREPLPITRADYEFPSPMTFLRDARTRFSKSLWVDIEKPFWWDAPVWVASGLVDSIGIANNHMQRGGMLPNEAWGRPRDTQRLPAPQGNGYWTQEIYYHLLNTGLRIPPSAGSASGVLNNPVGYNRAYVFTGPSLDYDAWWTALRAGRVFVSNGPLLRVRANGKLPGAVFKAKAGMPVTIELKGRIDSRDPVTHVDIVRNGDVAQRIPVADWKPGSTLARMEFKRSGWFLVRAIADVKHTFRFASTGPFHVEVGAEPRRVSRRSAAFFADWIRQRKAAVKLDDPGQRRAVTRFLDDAGRYWDEQVRKANAP